MEVKTKPTETFGKNLCICFSCKKKQSKYVCPKCSVPYCSLNCYKKHNEDCREEFYKEQVIQALKGRKAKKDEMDSLKEILTKTDQISDLVMEEMKEEILSKRLEEILQLSEKEDFFDGLREEEKKEFLSFVNSGAVVKYIEEWTPWWIDENNDYCIEVMSDEGYIALPEISKLCKNPSKFLILHILELVWNSVFVWRVYNGEIDENQEEIFRDLMKQSNVLSGNPACYESISDVIRECTNSAVKCNQQLANGLISPTHYECGLIFKSKWKTIKFLLEFYRFIQSVRVKNFFYSAGKKNFSKIAKKIGFFISYLKSQDASEFSQFVEEFKLFVSQWKLTNSLG